MKNVLWIFLCVCLTNVGFGQIDVFTVKDGRGKILRSIHFQGATYHLFEITNGVLYEGKDAVISDTTSGVVLLKSVEGNIEHISTLELGRTYDVDFFSANDQLLLSVASYYDFKFGSDSVQMRGVSTEFVIFEVRDDELSLQHHYHSFDSNLIPEITNTGEDYSISLITSSPEIYDENDKEISFEGASTDKHFYAMNFRYDDGLKVRDVIGVDHYDFNDLSRDPKEYFNSTSGAGSLLSVQCHGLKGFRKGVQIFDTGRLDSLHLAFYPLSFSIEDRKDPLKVYGDALIYLNFNWTKSSNDELTLFVSNLNPNNTSICLDERCYDNPYDSSTTLVLSNYNWKSGSGVFSFLGNKNRDIIEEVVQLGNERFVLARFFSKLGSWEWPSYFPEAKEFDRYFYLAKINENNTFENPIFFRANSAKRAFTNISHEKPAEISDEKLIVRGSCIGGMNMDEELYKGYNKESFSQFGIYLPIERLVGLQQQEVSSNSSLMIYPNPSHGQVYLQLKKELRHNTSANIYTSQGQLVKTQLLQKGAVVHTIDISNLAKGIYVIRVDQEDFNLHQRMVKN